MAKKRLVSDSAKGLVVVFDMANLIMGEPHFPGQDPERGDFFWRGNQWFKENVLRSMASIARLRVFAVYDSHALTQEVAQRDYNLTYISCRSDVEADDVIVRLVAEEYDDEMALWRSDVFVVTSDGALRSCVAAMGARSISAKRFSMHVLDKRGWKQTQLQWFKHGLYGVLRTLEAWSFLY